MKHFFKKSLLVFLCLCMMTLVLVSCSGGNKGSSDDGKKDSTTPQNTEETIDTRYVEELPELNFSGYELKIYMRNNDFFVSDMYFETYEDTRSFVDQAVFARNETVSERFGGVYYKLGRSNSENSDTSMMNSIKANNCEWDIIINHGHSMTSYAQNDALLNLYDIPYLDPTKGYWDQNLIQDLTLKDQLYVISGDISYQLLGHTDSMVFNKGLCDELKLAYPYEAVMKGDWTFALFSSMIKEANGDKNGDGKLVPEDGDIMGYVTDKYCGPINVLYSGGSKISENDGETYSINLYTDRHVSIFEGFFALVEQENCKIFTDWTSSTQLVKFRQTYANGEILFMDLRTYEISTLIEEGMLDYGVIPWPKWDSSVDKYYSWVDAGANIIGLPKTLSEERQEFVGAMLEALCAEGHREVLPVYYEQILKLKFSQDPQSHEIMDMIKAGRVYDMAAYFKSPVAMPGYSLVSYSGHNFTTWWESNRNMAESHVEQLNALFERLAEQ